MEFSGEARSKSKRTKPRVFKLNATAEEQLAYFSEARRKEAVPREMELPSPQKLDDEDESTS
jgi:hypothetical protein